MFLCRVRIGSHWTTRGQANLRRGVIVGDRASCVSDDQRKRHSLTVEYNQAIPSTIAINATENFKGEFVAKASYSIAPPANINATASAQASGSLTIP